ncbi:hypothetical protein EVAR_44133_1 [Eumeta japonica]|uniref:ATP-dependent DNA helicase n=1 Tax=Eumeta variegata TaxID=151549 RepID=A0A4C1XLQ9_EUMVA|nr:hypothetical protein EVAR_44133_1 [Eumeta japonica]
MGKQAVASSGIAATLLNDGKTAHSTFKLPPTVLLEQHSVRSIRKMDRSGPAVVQLAFVPRILVIATDLPIPFKRLQYPVKISFALTINKYRGQTFSIMGIDLNKQCFSHVSKSQADQRPLAYNAATAAAYLIRRPPPGPPLAARRRASATAGGPLRFLRVRGRSLPSLTGGRCAVGSTGDSFLDLLSSFYGPGTKLQSRLARDDMSINPFDSACCKHDIAYSKRKKIFILELVSNVADRVLTSKAMKRVFNRDPSMSEKADALHNATAMAAKAKFGLEIKTGALTGGAAGILKIVNIAKDAVEQLKEQKRHNEKMEEMSLGKENLGEKNEFIVKELAVASVKDEEGKEYTYPPLAFESNMRDIVSADPHKHIPVRRAASATECRINQRGIVLRRGVLARRLREPRWRVCVLSTGPLVRSVEVYSR